MRLIASMRRSNDGSLGRLCWKNALVSVGDTQVSSDPGLMCSGARSYLARQGRAIAADDSPTSTAPSSHDIARGWLFGDIRQATLLHWQRDELIIFAVDAVTSSSRVDASPRIPQQRSEYQWDIAERRPQLRFGACTYQRCSAAHSTFIDAASSAALPCVISIASIPPTATASGVTIHFICRSSTHPRGGCTDTRFATPSSITLPAALCAANAVSFFRSGLYTTARPRDELESTGTGEARAGCGNQAGGSTVRPCPGVNRYHSVLVQFGSIYRRLGDPCRTIGRRMRTTSKYRNHRFVGSFVAARHLARTICADQ